MQKIFLSASDVAFATNKGIKTHTVYTPYVVLDYKALGKTILNPNVFDGRFERAARLSFEIRRAVHLQDMNYGCELAAIADGAAFWTQDITTEGAGPLSALHW